MVKNKNKIGNMCWLAVARLWELFLLKWNAVNEKLRNSSMQIGIALMRYTRCNLLSTPKARAVIGKDANVLTAIILAAKR